MRMTGRTIVLGPIALAGLAAVCCFAGCTGKGPDETKAGGPTGNWEPTTRVASSPELLQLGKSVYEKQCSACHGVDGKGNGAAAYLLYPKPRDFAAARYRLVSTWDGVPTDDDLFGTVSRGMPGSAMPSWAHLPERTRWGLVHYVKSLAAEPLVVLKPTPEEPELGVIDVPPETPDSDAARARAGELFAQGCAPCHGATGKGDGVQKQVDTEGFPTRPRDLTLGVFKGSPAPESLYRRLFAGLPGSPMPSSSYSNDEAWALVRYCLAMSSEKQRERVEMKKFRITAPRTTELPTHPDSGSWRNAPRVNLHLMPLWWRPNRPEELTVQALHDGTSLVMRLSWTDETHDHTAIRPQDFRDAAAVQFSLTPDPPFFAMGSAGHFVNLWMWKSERQADVEVAFQDLDRVYPNIGIDSYPNLQRSPLEQPTRHALTLESDPAFVTAWGAGNIVADPTRQSPAEDLLAQGFGTLSARPKPDQAVEAVGLYSTGTYRVVFHRSLAGRGERRVSMKPGNVVAVGFAVWNGSAGDRDGKKSVTIWQDLKLER